MDILLVEDNPNDAELAMLALRRARFSGEITHAEDGLEAFRILGLGGESKGEECSWDPLESTCRHASLSIL